MSTRWRHLAGLVTAAAVVVGALIVVVPGWLVAFDARGGQLATVDRVQAVNSARATLLQAIGGLVLLLGAAQAWRQLAVAREGQVTDRYARAIEQLGSEHLRVRVGGIFALERIARDSPRDRATIVEILATFVRERSTWQQHHPEHSDPDDPHAARPPAARRVPIEQLPYLRFRAPDVQAAVIVLGRRPPAPGGDAPMELRDVDLRKGNLGGADLRGARLRGALLDRVYLREARLDGADLSRTSLQGANLHGARLERADLREADLAGAFYLDTAVLAGAKAWGTTWPAGFDPEAAGVIEVPPSRKGVPAPRGR